METYRLDLEFLDNQRSDLPRNPIAYVYVKTFSKQTADGPPLITTDCVTLREFEDQVNSLKLELDVILKKARVKFAADNRRQAARAGKS